jgi:hypothetical protein
MPGKAISAIEAKLFRPTPLHVSAIFDLTGAMDQLLWPPRLPSARQDNLWRTTCFEVFTRDVEGTGYSEFNLSPSGQWAAYTFADYREGIRPLKLAVAPELRVEGQTKDEMIFEARITLPGPVSSAIALSAVIEECDGTKSYWALAHPADKPDFHDPACFTATLPAPRAA